MDLSTRYMGLALKNPLVASASPVTGSLDGVRLLEDAGAGAIVLPSLFQEEIEAEDARYDHLSSRDDDSWPEAGTNFPVLGRGSTGPHVYLEMVRRACDATSIPVIGSLNGITDEGWIEYAQSIEQAGAQGLEVNVYFIPTDIGLTGRDVEKRYLDILWSVKAAVSIPVAVKLSPYFSSIGNMASQLQDAGADALVLFNRFYQPDLDIVALKVLTDLKLSEPNEIRFPLLWLAVLSGRLNVSLGAATGVATSDEIVKYLLVGADAVMTTSALLRHGPGYLADLLEGVRTWCVAREFTSLEQVRGLMSQQRLRNPEAFERANYVRILQGYGHIGTGPAAWGRAPARSALQA